MPDGIASSPKGGAKSCSVFKLDETESKIAKGSPFGRAGAGAPERVFNGEAKKALKR